MRELIDRFTLDNDITHLRHSVEYLIYEIEEHLIDEIYDEGYSDGFDEGEDQNNEAEQLANDILNTLSRHGY